MSAAHDVPIDLSEVGDVALRTRELASSGSQMPKAVADFLRRTTDPNRPPLTYAEARDFASNASRIAFDESQRLTPTMRRQVSQFSQALNGAIEQAADSVGKGDLYRQAMAEYADAMKWQARGEAAQDFAAKRLLALIAEILETHNPYLGWPPDAQKKVMRALAKPQRDFLGWPVSAVAKAKRDDLHAKLAVL